MFHRGSRLGRFTGFSGCTNGFRLPSFLLGLLLFFLFWGALRSEPIAPSPQKQLDPAVEAALRVRADASILLDKASPLNANPGSRLLRYIVDGTLPQPPPRLLLRRQAPIDVSGDADFESYSNKDFRRYQKGTVFGSDNFKNYSVDERRPGHLRPLWQGRFRDRAVHYYALSTNVAGSGFTSYDDNSNAGSGIFRYGMQSNVQARLSPPTAPAAANDFKDYGKDTNAMSSTFTVPSRLQRRRQRAPACSRATASRRISRSDFLSYGNDGNGDFNQFSSYGEQASQSDNSFRSYARATTPHSRTSPTTATLPPPRRTSSSSTIRTPAASTPSSASQPTSATRLPSSSTSARREPHRLLQQQPGFGGCQRGTGEVFPGTNLAEGKRIPMPDIRDRCRRVRSSLGTRREAAVRVSALPELVRLLGAADLQGSMAKTVAECERPAVKDETKRCPTSLEAMAEFAASVLGKSAAVSTTASTAGWGRRCLFPYLVYYCHAVPRVAVYDVELKEDAGGEAVNHGVAICHLDTTQWSAGHAAFVCHWIFENDLIWVARDG
ncbi:unnamed protein product [Spirodela intermedia]|uniref:BURP domain-containing protein n=1 Tax=Spirodela intermedia TaxID=51605 RepID=A0ABN7E834_SPIIN|nr:unnamed protein product [Spirodela intermedia]